MTGPLTVQELGESDMYLLLKSQEACFAAELDMLRSRDLPNSSCLLHLRPTLDCCGRLRVGGRGQNSDQPYCTQHPIILHGKHPFVRMLIREEHLCLQHTGPTLLAPSLNRCFYITSGHRVIRSITRGCARCRRYSAKPQPPIMGQLPRDRITPDMVFSRVCVDYAGPVLIKHAHVRRSTVVKAYICVFVSLSVKAVHLELVSDLTTEAFIAALRRFTARRGKPVLIRSDHGSNFMGAARELKQLVTFLKQQVMQEAISDFCSCEGMSVVSL